MKTRLYTPFFAAVAALALSSCGVDWNSLAHTALEVATTDYSNQTTTQEYDESGVPIYGYDGDNAVYGYDSNNQPIYDTALLANAVSVPNWAPLAGAPRVAYPSHARRLAGPPPQVRQRAHLKHRNPRHVSPGPRPGRRDAVHGPRPDRQNANHGPGKRPGQQNADHGSKQRPERGKMGPGRRPENQSQKPTRPTAPNGVKVAQVPSTTAKPSSSSSYVCMSCQLGDTLIKKCTNPKCANYGNPPSSYKKS